MSLMLQAEKKCESQLQNFQRSDRAQVRFLLKAETKINQNVIQWRKVKIEKVSTKMKDFPSCFYIFNFTNRWALLRL